MTSEPSQQISATARPCWKGDLFRALAIIMCASLLGFLFNAFSERPVPLLAADGPGALPVRAPRITTRALDEALRRGDIIALLDVRSDAAYEAGHPRGALHMSAEDPTRGFTELEPELRTAEVIVVVCDSAKCVSGDRVAKLLAGLRIPNTKVLEGGWEAYRDSGLEQGP